jgi:hypothetical protein
VLAIRQPTPNMERNAAALSATDAAPSAVAVPTLDKNVDKATLLAILDQLRVSVGDGASL